MNADQDHARSILKSETRWLSISEAQRLWEIAVGTSPANALEPYRKPHDRFFREIRPLIALASHTSASALRIQEHGTSIDGFLRSTAGNVVAVECTSAVDDEQGKLQWEVFARGERAPLTGLYARDEDGRAILIDDGMRDVEKFNLTTQLPLMNTRVAKKVNKSTRNDDYRGAVLLVTFDDFLSPNGKAKQDRYDPVCAACLLDNPSATAIFANIVFAGLSGEYVFDGNEGRSSLLTS